MSDDYAALREEYSRAGLTEDDLSPEPFALFRRWFEEVRPLTEPNAMVLATVNGDGRPSSRAVLGGGHPQHSAPDATIAHSRVAHAHAAERAPGARVAT